MPEFEYQGATLHYGDSDRGDPLLLLHSGGSSGAQWRKTGEHLGGKYRLLTPDFYGHGGSEAWSRPKALQHDDQADLVAAVIGDVGLAASTIDIVDHSYGGAGAVRMVLRKLANIRSLVLIEPMVACLLRELSETDALAELEGIQDDFRERLAKDGPEAAWQGFLDFRNEPGTWVGYAEKTQQNFIRRTPAQLANFNANANNRTTQAEVQSIDKSTLVIRGVDTSLYDMRMSEIVAENIPGAKLLILEDAGHMSPLTHPERVTREILHHIGTETVSA